MHHHRSAEVQHAGSLSITSGIAAAISRLSGGAAISRRMRDSTNFEIAQMWPSKTAQLVASVCFVVVTIFLEIRGMRATSRHTGRNGTQVHSSMRTWQHIFAHARAAHTHTQSRIMIATCAMCLGHMLNAAGCCLKMRPYHASRKGNKTQRDVT